jgi:prevent-host-death family protein
MIQANVREAKARLSSYLAKVEQGEEVVILRRGRPVAVLKPLEQPTRLPSLQEFRRKVKVKGLSASETLIRMRRESRY